MSIMDIYSCFKIKNLEGAFDDGFLKDVHNYDKRAINFYLRQAF